MNKLRCKGHVDRMEEGRSALKILTCKLKVKRLLGMLMRRWEDILKLILKK